MQPKIEPGMLCLIVGGPNRGKSCITLRLIPDNGPCMPELFGRNGVGQAAWLIQGNDLIVHSSVNGGPKMAQYGPHALCASNRLLPIQPDNHIKQTEVKRIKVPSNAKELTAT